MKRKRFCFLFSLLFLIESVLSNGHNNGQRRASPREIQKIVRDPRAIIGHLETIAKKRTELGASTHEENYLQIFEDLSTISSMEAVLIFDHYDADNSGDLEESEVHNYMYDLLELETGVQSEVQSKILAATTLNNFDEDESGSLDYSEMASLLDIEPNVLDGLNVDYSPDEIDPVFAYYDRSKNGVIDGEELNVLGFDLLRLDHQKDIEWFQIKDEVEWALKKLNLTSEEEIDKQQLTKLLQDFLQPGTTLPQISVSNYATTETETQPTLSASVTTTINPQIEWESENAGEDFYELESGEIYSSGEIFEEKSEKARKTKDFKSEKPQTNAIQWEPEEIMDKEDYYSEFDYSGEIFSGEFLVQASGSGEDYYEHESSGKSSKHFVEMEQQADDYDESDIGLSSGELLSGEITEDTYEYSELSALTKTNLELSTNAPKNSKNIEWEKEEAEDDNEYEFDSGWFESGMIEEANYETTEVPQTKTSKLKTNYSNVSQVTTTESSVWETYEPVEPEVAENDSDFGSGGVYEETNFSAINYDNYDEEEVETASGEMELETDYVGFYQTTEQPRKSTAGKIVNLEITTEIPVETTANHDLEETEVSTIFGSGSVIPEVDHVTEAVTEAEFIEDELDIEKWLKKHYEADLLNRVNFTSERMQNMAAILEAGLEKITVANLIFGGDKIEAFDNKSLKMLDFMQTSRDRHYEARSQKSEERELLRRLNVMHNRIKQLRRVVREGLEIITIPNLLFENKKVQSYGAETLQMLQDHKAQRADMKLQGGTYQEQYANELEKRADELRQRMGDMKANLTESLGSNNVGTIITDIIMQSGR
ncbi:uncharacterized protein LOC134855917 [Symsagittifera roscoffensis]|uniref:uncharacterized protein LOC134855917 n=1 Tax=Symsagittifera roscoffensis TaxID=84072 RepID=UPI00307B2B48